MCDHSVTNEDIVRKKQKKQEFLKRENSEADTENSVCKCDFFMVTFDFQKVCEIIFISEVMTKNKHKAASCHLWLHFHQMWKHH